MKVDELKYVVGEAQEAKPVYMRFYGKIDEESTRNFNDEFLWIQDYVKPSKIVISINSEGGSVLYGMGTFSIIQQCPIEVETIVEGLAASMASVLWAAGTRSYMRDYSILMIHNPFIRDEKSCNPDNEQIVNAFQKQIETIYHKRFGLTKAKVREIMDGKEGCDGTYFDAKSAVNAGILSAECVLKTSKQVWHSIVLGNIIAITLIHQGRAVTNSGTSCNSVHPAICVRTAPQIIHDRYCKTFVYPHIFLGGIEFCFQPEYCVLSLVNQQTVSSGHFTGDIGCCRRSVDMDCCNSLIILKLTTCAA